MKRFAFFLSVILGIAFDILFWDKPQGISFIIFIFILLLFGYLLLRKLSITEYKKGYIFLIPILVFSVFSFIRAEPFTAFLNRWLTIALIGIFAFGYRSGLWMQFGLIDHISKALRLSGHMISVPWLRSNQLAIFTDENNKPGKKNNLKPILRGILIAAPIIILFSALFASADMVFEASLENLLSYLKITNLGEILGRMFLIFLAANAFLGLITFTVLQSSEKKLIGNDTAFVSPFLGVIETTIIQASVILLFLTFLIVQFKYFFFNNKAILEMGYTYSEYARKGFGELIAISVFSLGLILILNTITVKNNQKEERVFALLNIWLVLCNLVVLVSSYMRLFLYESAYGFTRLRTYSHVFIIWIGILLIITAILIWRHRSRFFTNASIMCLLGFSLTLNIVNVDGFIVRKNLEHTFANNPLDAPYFPRLSTDAIPALVSAYKADSISQSMKIELGTSLACFRSNHLHSLNDMRWQTFTISKLQANRYLNSVSADIDEYEVIEREWEFLIRDPNGKETACYQPELLF